MDVQSCKAQHDKKRKNQWKNESGGYLKECPGEEVEWNVMRREYGLNVQERRLSGM